MLIMHHIEWQLCFTLCTVSELYKRALFILTGPYCTLKMPISSDADPGRTRLIQLIMLRIFGYTIFFNNCAPSISSYNLFKQLSIKPH
jgi:hypothetical protein